MGCLLHFLKRWYRLECIHRSGIAFPFPFSPPAWPFVQGVCRCSRGHNIPIFISWIYSDAKAPSQWTTPAPSAVSASHNACCSGRYILIHPHIANQCLRLRNGLRLESFQIIPPYLTGKSILYLGSHRCKLPVILHAKLDANSAWTFKKKTL